MDKVHYRLWAHFVWTTKNREPLLTNKVIFKLCTHLKNESKFQEYNVDVINGYLDHIHCLIAMRPSLSFSKVANHLKGYSSKWLNETGLIQQSNIWQRGYSVFTVSESNIFPVRKYIIGQKEHHQNAGFDDEMNRLLKSNLFGGTPAR